VDNPPLRGPIACLNGLIQDGLHMCVLLLLTKVPFGSRKGTATGSKWIKDGKRNGTCPYLFCLVEQTFTAGIFNRPNRAGMSL